MGAKTRSITVNRNRGIYIYPPCYVTVRYGVLRNSYAVRGSRLEVEGQRNTKTPQCYAKGVTVR